MGWRTGFLALLVCLAAAAPARAQRGPITVGRGGELGGFFASEQQYQPGAPGSGGTVRQLWVRFPVRGYLLSPYLVSFELEAQPTAIRQQWDGFQGDQQSDLLNLVYAVSLLPGFPVSVTINGAESSNGTSGGPGGQRQFDRSLFSAQLHAGFRPLPLRLSYQRELVDETWLPDVAAAVPFRTRGVFRSFRASASNSKLSLEAYQTAYDDQVRDQDYVLQGLHLTHRFRWGRGSSLESGLGLSHQDGSFASQRQEWTERLQLYHAPRVRTDYTWSRTAYRTPGGESRNRSLTAGAAVTVSRAVGVGAVLSSTRSSAGAAQDRSFYFAPRLGLGLGTVATGRFDANAVVGIERRAVSGTGSEQPVFDEEHDVGAARLVTLDRPDVVSGTVVVRNPGSTITYLEEADYAVTSVGRLTQLRIPVTSRLRVGDRILVSYRVRSRETGVGTSARADVNVSFEWRGWSLRHQRSVRQVPDGHGTGPDAPEVSTGPLFEDLDESRTRLAFHGRTPVGELAAGTGMRSRTIGSLHTVDYDLNTSLTPPRLGPSQTTLMAGWTSTAADERSQEALTLSGSTTIMLGPRVLVSTSLEHTDVRVVDGSRQRWLVGRSLVSMRVERLLIDLQGELFREQLPITRSRTRVHLRVTRSF